MSKSFGERLRGLRRGKKKNQHELASFLGLSQTTIANYENNSRFPNDVTLLKLADYFQVSLDYLMGRTEDASPFLPDHQKSQDNPAMEQDWSQRYLESLIRTDIREAWRILLLASQMGVPLKTIHDQILRPALYQAGILWQKGKMDIAQEHFITSETERFISLLRQKPSMVNTGPLIVTMAAGDERHTLGIRMISSSLEEAGYTVMFLGNQLPFSSLQFILNQYPVKVVALSASLPSYVNDVSFIIRSMREHDAYQHIKIIVGGQGFQDAGDLWKKIGADAYAEDTTSAVEAVSRLIEENIRK